MPCSQTDLSCRSIPSVAIGVTARHPRSRAATPWVKMPALSRVLMEVEEERFVGSPVAFTGEPAGGRDHGLAERLQSDARTADPPVSRCFPRDESAWRVGLCSGGARHRRTARHFPQETAGHGEGSRPSQGARLVLVRKADVAVDLPSANATKGRTGPCQKSTPLSKHRIQPPAFQ